MHENFLPSGNAFKTLKRIYESVNELKPFNSSYTFFGNYIF